MKSSMSLCNSFILFLTLQSCFFFLFSSMNLASCELALPPELADNDAGEVVVRIAAEDATTKRAVVDALVRFGHGPDCPRAGQPHVDVKIPGRLLAELESVLRETVVGSGLNMTLVEDPTRVEFERFLEQQVRSKRYQRDPFKDLYNRYHSQSDIEAFLQAIVATYPHIARNYSIGKSTNGNQLWAVQISDNPGENELEEVEFQYIANMHGDEVVGREISLYFIYYLCSNYEQPRIKAIIDSMNIHILPTMNPDGFARSARSNARGTDLNRSFPDQFSTPSWGGSKPLPPLDQGDGSFVLPSGNLEPETSAVMKWMGQHNFALSANFHGGSVVANYPYDGNRGHISQQYSKSPDDDLFRQLARTYAANNRPMSSSREFPGGITNGADWYVLYGGMQDYAYLWHGAMHITVELSNAKWPPATQLSTFWNDNRESMLAYMEAARNRVWGVVSDCNTGAPITVGYVLPGCGANCRLQASKLDPQNGDYHRLLPQVTGSQEVRYTLTATAPGYASATKSISLGLNTPMPLRVDFCLQQTN